MPHEETTRQGIELSARQRVAWLRLIRSDNIGPVTFRELINHFGSAEKALDALPELSRRGGSSRSPRIATQAEAEGEIETADKFGARFIGIGEPDYPPALRHLDGAPPLIAMKGSADAATRPCVGIVGSRNASINGAKFAAMLARDCARAGYTIASGLARGIDAAAHRASLATGTVAMLAGGLDRPYPQENFGLLQEIYDQGGATISEMPFGWEPRSGSLITARLAGEAGRLVFAVPGSPLDARCEGTNRLIKEGAMLTTGADDILEALRPLMEPQLPYDRKIEEPRSDTEMSPPGDDERSIIAAALGPSPVETDDIIRHTGFSAATVHLVLLELDIAGRLNRHAGGRVSLFIAD
ncbi:DNA-protecting protein DprA [Rhizobium sp. SEMIA 439]|uniref:DNA-processing protein DprA n=1 Tax=Agrobacterium radiobacter TaxID=362 RepID=UPI00108227AF|nr:DNA-processing protein DprA [Agrobacterium radiobacter]MBB4322740.1 DNA processing protein [Agrobacterium radiobacter]MBB4484773.1 DNA processing protein [Agrobacterium radiobacter]TGE82561.1 DNA-protecting protein DprA [Rhizobium sp. SEMIA 439]